MFDAALALKLELVKLDTSVISLVLALDVSNPLTTLTALVKSRAVFST
jgi:hypothetical protein